MKWYESFRAADCCGVKVGSLVPMILRMLLA
jgi:hypothetical protein